MAIEERYLRGAFIGFDSDNLLGSIPTIVIFRFNPEKLTRSFSVEGTPARQGNPPTGEPADEPETQNAYGGTLRQSFSVTVRFDLHERADYAQSILPDFGIMPELAAIESLMYPAEGDILGAITSLFGGASPISQRNKRKIVLFIWGKSKLLPVHVKSLTVNETKHNPGLAPIRAEVEVGCEVLTPSEVQGCTIAEAALTFEDVKRKLLSVLYLTTTVDLIGNVLPLP